jgi:hypothetical protein
MNEYTTTPGRANIGGNIIGPELGDLNDLDIFQNHNSLIEYGPAREIDNEEILFIRISYSP